MEVTEPRVRVPEEPAVAPQDKEEQGEAGYDGQRLDLMCGVSR